MSAARRSGPPGRSAPAKAAITSRSSWTIRASPSRSTPISSSRGRRHLQPDLVPQPQAERRVSQAAASPARIRRAGRFATRCGCRIAPPAVLRCRQSFIKAPMSSAEHAPTHLSGPDRPGLSLRHLALTLKFCRVSIPGARQCFMVHRHSARLQSF